MTYRETLQRLIDLDWDGENVEFNMAQGGWILLRDWNCISTLSRELRLTRAEVERRTGRKVIEWRKPKLGDRAYLANDGQVVEIVPAWFTNPTVKWYACWILGDKLGAPEPCKTPCKDAPILCEGCPFPSIPSTPKTRQPLTMSEIMLNHNEVMALAIEVDGMKAENQARAHREEAPAYYEQSFVEKAEQVRALTKAIMDRAKEEATQ